MTNLIMSRRPGDHDFDFLRDDFDFPRDDFNEPYTSDDHLTSKVILTTMKIRKLLLGDSKAFKNTSEVVRKFSITFLDAHVYIHAYKQPRQFQEQSELRNTCRASIKILRRLYEELFKHIQSESRRDLPTEVIKTLERLSQQRWNILDILRRFDNNTSQLSTATLQRTREDATKVQRHQDVHVRTQSGFTTQPALTTPKEIDFSKMTEEEFIQWEKDNGVYELNQSTPVSIEEAAKFLGQYEAKLTA